VAHLDVQVKELQEELALSRTPEGPHGARKWPAQGHVFLFFNTICVFFVLCSFRFCRENIVRTL